MNSFERPITPGFLLRFTLPSMAMMLFNSFYTMVDGGFVSNFVNTDALSAINIVFPLINLVLAASIMIASGGSAVTARQMGEQEPPLARESFPLLTAFAAALGVAIAVLTVLFADPLVRLLGATDALYGYCREYLVFVSLFTPCCMLQILFQFFFVTAGKPNFGLAATLLGGVTNIVLDYVFIVPLGMGIRGAAVATGLGQTVPTVIGLCYFFSRRNPLLYYTRPVLRGRVLAFTCLNGSSEMVSNLAVAITTFLFNLIMLSYLGEDGVAAITIVFYAQFFFTAIFFGYTSGVAPLISYHFGANDRDRLKRLVRLSLLFVAVCSLAAYGLSVVLSRAVVGVFTPACPACGSPSRRRSCSRWPCRWRVSSASAAGITTCKTTADKRRLAEKTLPAFFRIKNRGDYSSASAMASSCASFSAVSAERMVTVSSQVMFLLFSSMPDMTLAAIGAHEPFSIRPIVRF